MKPNVNSGFHHKKFQNGLIDWYKSQQRDLPWRKNQDPYKIWVSEVMLQQTRVDTVIPYFEAFVNRFPTVEALAEADEVEVLKAWEGLGYYSRARNLQAGVREVHEKYNGKVPDDHNAISKLKGVGPYTAGAILSIAYGKPEPAVDGNVMRVMSRVLSISEDIAKQRTRKRFESIVKEMIPEGQASEFNQGLMELGAVICTPKSPKCLLCPVQSHCKAFAQGKQDELPVKGKKKPPKLVKLAVAVIRNGKNEVLIRRRPNTGLLAGMWEFPCFEVSGTGKKEQLNAKLSGTYGARVEWKARLRNVQHVFTHLKWELAVYEGEIREPLQRQKELEWASVDKLSQYPFPVSHQKIISMIQKGDGENEDLR